MTEEQYINRRNAILMKMYQHEDKFADGRPKFPRCLKAVKRALKALDEEWRKEGTC